MLHSKHTNKSFYIPEFSVPKIDKYQGNENREANFLNNGLISVKL
jgi:hypothetical protein